MDYNFKRFFFRSEAFNPNFNNLNQKSANQASTDLTGTIRSKHNFGFILVSFGVLLAAASGSWDITNHLLNKPETFFSPPHAGLYGGVGLTVFALIWILCYCRCWGIADQKGRSSPNTDSNVRIVVRKLLPIPVKIVALGVALLVIAGPFDFAWHSAFGLDGLLSPSHLALTMGLVLSSVGSLLGILSGQKTKLLSRQKENKALGIALHRHDVPFHNYLNNKSTIMVILVVIPVWITLVGLTHMLSLPFSNTEYFKFNPNPTFGAVLATMALPFIGAFLLTFSFQLTGRFGIVLVTGGTFILINLITSILPNEHIIPTIPFYILNLIPFLVVDIILSDLFVPSNKILIYGLSGAIIGATFFMLYFPLITYTYNEVMPYPRAVWPSLITLKYFEMIALLYPILALPSLLMGVLGALFGSSWKINQIQIRR